MPIDYSFLSYPNVLVVVAMVWVEGSFRSIAPCLRVLELLMILVHERIKIGCLSSIHYDGIISL